MMPLPKPKDISIFLKEALTKVYFVYGIISHLYIILIVLFFVLMSKNNKGP
jgi:hypothetical protein